MAPRLRCDGGISNTWTLFKIGIPIYRSIWLSKSFHIVISTVLLCFKAKYVSGMPPINTQAKSVATCRRGQNALLHGVFTSYEGRIIIVFFYVRVSIKLFNSTQEISYKTSVLLIAAECVVTISQCGGTTKRVKTAGGNASEEKTINNFKRMAMNVPL